jgi:hypothetical protein
MDANQPTRRTPRYPFVAAAEVIDEGTGDKMSVQVKELSLFGCYLDTQSPLPTRTKVIVKVYTPAELFEAGATVIYSNPTLGMGLVFREVKPFFLTILGKWLLAAMQEAQRQDQGERAYTEPGGEHREASLGEGSANAGPDRRSSVSHEDNPAGGDGPAGEASGSTEEPGTRNSDRPRKGMR